ncbi:MAG: hypothetical protein AB4352_08850 [Hormoscilla sp.]
MQLSTVYKERLKAAYEKGFQQGLQQAFQEGIMRERQSVLACILRIRFGEIDTQLEAIIPEIITLSAPEYIPIVLELSRQELLARFSGN